MKGTECPECGEELDYDEVDIGVGTFKGNYRCPNPACGWIQVQVGQLIGYGRIKKRNPNKEGRGR